MANHALWQVLHLLCILAHIGMVVAGIATSVIRGYNTMKDDSGAVSIIGVIGMMVNVWIFVGLRAVSKPRDERTKDQYFKQILAFTASIMFQSTMTAVNITIGCVVAGQASRDLDLAAVSALAIIAGIVSLATDVVDISQLGFYRQGYNGVGHNFISVSDT